MPLPLFRAWGQWFLILLCLCVFMQVLGAPTSLWTLEPAEDVLEESTLEGYSIPAWQASLDCRSSQRVSFDFQRAVPERLPDGAPFRPPCAA